MQVDGAESAVFTYEVVQGVVVRLRLADERRPDPRADRVLERAARAVVLDVRLERDGTQHGLPEPPRVLVEPLP